MAISTLLALGPAVAAGHFSDADPAVDPQLLASDDAGPRQTEAAISECTGSNPNQGSVPIDEDVAITGSFGRDLERSYVMLPFRVPGGTDAIRVKYCHDQPAVPDPGGINDHTIDVGLYEPESDADGDDLWGEAEFRGWGGSSRKDVTLSAEGAIDADPNPVATEGTTVGFLPGPIPAGEWAVELGVAAIGQEGSTEDGEVAWRVEIDLIDDPSFSDQPYRPVPYDTTPARGEPGWYAGDFHVHARNSAPGDATMRETFSYAFCPDPAIDQQLCDALPDETEPGAGLDFITLSDYVSTRHWGEIGAFQADYPGHLVVRSAEVITYRGHVNNHASLDWADYRTGPVHVATVQGAGTDQTIEAIDVAKPARAARPASEILDGINDAGGWNQLNHVETFPSEIPTFGNLCRGCSWEYSDQETRYPKVDAIEIATGPAGLQEDPEPGPNPFTPLAIQFWEDAIDADGPSSNHIAAVGSSDSHNAGRTPNPVTQSPIGQATTVVRAKELSERGIQRGVEAGHTYVKIWGPDGPDLRLAAFVGESEDRAGIMGDAVRAEEARFEARVLNLNAAQEVRPGAYALFVIRDGLPFQGPIPLAPDAEGRAEVEFESAGPGRYRLQVERTASGVRSIEAVSSPIYLETGSAERCTEARAGTDGDDELRGTKRSDRLKGKGGDDVLKGRRGPDCLRGGPGDDALHGGRSRDLLVGGTGRDRLVGGAGRDRIRARDGEADVVICKGADRVKADAKDRLRGCTTSPM